MKHYRRNAWTPWLWGQVSWWGISAPWERSPTLCSKCSQHHGAPVQSRLAYCPAWGEFWDLWRRTWTDWAQHACQWQKTVTNQTPMPQPSKQLLNACPVPPMHIIAPLLAGCQSAILSSNEWHNDMNLAFISTIMAPNFKIKEITSGTRRYIPIPNQNIC